jgi:soluble lytic murein transglycosylase
MTEKTIDLMYQAIRLPAFLIAMMLALAATSFAVQAKETKADRTESSPDKIAAAAIKVLSDEDTRRYRRIFAIQKKGRWSKANKEIRKLKDKLLLGHVQAQRYLHPTQYRSRYRELAVWLKRYADHPQSRQLYKLALKRKPGRARRPRSPLGGQAKDFNEFPWERDTSYVSTKRRSSAKRRAARNIIRKIRRYAHRGRLTVARRVIARTQTRRTLDRVEMAIARAYLARGYFFHGSARKSYDYGGPAAKIAGKYMPSAHWVAGLAAYRLGKHAEAAGHFEAMAESGGGSGWTLAAAGFWAARANMVAGKPDRVTSWLEVAAAHPRTFYGLLAARILGLNKSLDWKVPGLNQGHVDTILDHRGGKRGLALIQIGQSRLAERELRYLTALETPKMAHALLALAETLQLPSLSLKTASMFTQEDGAALQGALYPLPKWQPTKGFTVDRAVVYAFMRQESRFNPNARSHAGARGLMQLMPATAGFIAKKRFRGRNRARLYDPELNMSLGQKYIEHLISNDMIKGNMLLVAAAYNGGPGNLSRWRRRAARNQFLDPLMFIESIPARETRIFIERVLSNVWIYRQRLGQDAPSLDALAAGETPFYKSLDRRSVAKNVRN